MIWYVNFPMSRFPVDKTVRVALQCIASVAVLIVGLIVVFLAVESRDAIVQLGTRLFRDASWHPAETIDGLFGIFPIVLGTILVALGSILIAAPAGLASAIFSQFYAPRPVAFVYRRLVELLVGIPSVVYGFWGLVVLCPVLAEVAKWFGGGTGISLLAAILIVAMMILPTVMLISEGAIKSVCPEYISGATALGMGKFSIIRNIVLPQSKVGIATGIVLAIARAIGETMAVLMVAGNIAKVPDSLFAPVRTLTANIALEMGYAVGVQRSTLFFSGLILLILVAALFACEIFMRRVVWRSQ